MFFSWPSRSSFVGAVAALALFAGVGCGDDEPLSPTGTMSTSSSGGGAGAGGSDPTGPGEVLAIYSLPKDLADLSDKRFFDHPWPSDLRVENGSPRIKGYYNPKNLPLLDEYMEAVTGVLDGFSPAGAGYLRFDGALDPDSLPGNPKEGLAENASVQLIDIEKSSPEYGQRHLTSIYFREAEGVYWRSNTLAFMPTFGFPLRPHTRYALVVTTRAKAKGERKLVASPTVRSLLGIEATTSETKAAHDALAPSVGEIVKAGIALDEIAHFSVFTTGDPTAEMFALRDGFKDAVAAPTADPEQWKVHDTEDEDFDEYLGWYGPSPNFQHGTMPFQQYGDGGDFEFDDTGTPVLADTFDLRFSLMVPKADKCPMPVNGYPIVLYAHGTGGDYRSYTRDDAGLSVAQQCVATMGIDQIFHGERPGAPEDGDDQKIEILFFNFQNIVAARANTRQAAIDEMQRARLFQESHMTVPASVSTTGQEILFDADKLMFFGHSQGGLNGPLYFAADDSARGGVLSGSSAELSITLLEKTEPSPSVAGLVKSVFLFLNSEEQEEVNFFHPGISFGQTMVDVVDPIHYARFTVLEPRAGFAPKSIYMTEGIDSDGTGDSYAPPHGIEAHSIAMGLPVQLPETHPILETRYGGPQPVTVPVDGLSGNLANGKASGVLAQWAVPFESDGHFVVFDVPEAQAQAAAFIKGLAANPKGHVSPP